MLINSSCITQLRSLTLPLCLYCVKLLPYKVKNTYVVSTYVHSLMHTTVTACCIRKSNAIYYRSVSYTQPHLYLSHHNYSCGHLLGLANFLATNRKCTLKAAYGTHAVCLSNLPQSPKHNACLTLVSGQCGSHAVASSTKRVQTHCHSGSLCMYAGLPSIIISTSPVSVVIN